MPYYKDSQIILFWAESTQFLIFIPIYLRSIVILSSHLRLGLPKYLFPVGLPIKVLKALLPTSILTIWHFHLNLLDLITWRNGSIIVPIHKKGDKMNCNKCRGISLLSNSYKILSNIILSRMTPYANEIRGEYQCRFRRNRSTIDHILRIMQILKKVQ